MRTANWVCRALGAGTIVIMMAPATPAQQGPLGPVSISATEIAEVRQANSVVTRMARTGDLRVVRVVSDPLIPGRVHERLAQYQQGLPVFGSDVTRQTDGGLTTSIFGSIHADIQLDTVPTLSADDAIAVVDTPEWRSDGPPRFRSS